jgi:hypothetical protein
MKPETVFKINRAVRVLTFFSAIALAAVLVMATKQVLHH